VFSAFGKMVEVRKKPRGRLARMNTASSESDARANQLDLSRGHVEETVSALFVYVLLSDDFCFTRWVPHHVLLSGEGQT